MDTAGDRGVRWLCACGAIAGGFCPYLAASSGQLSAPSAFAAGGAFHYSDVAWQVDRRNPSPPSTQTRRVLSSVPANRLIWQGVSLVDAGLTQRYLYRVLASVLISDWLV